jgi:hypothetical protein
MDAPARLGIDGTVQRVRGIKPELLAEFEHQGTFGSTPRFGQ